MNPTGYLCGPRLYEFEGWFFEDAKFTGGPWPLKKTANCGSVPAGSFTQYTDDFLNFLNPSRKPIVSAGDAYRLDNNCYLDLYSYLLRKPNDKLDKNIYGPGKVLRQLEQRPIH